MKNNKQKISKKKNIKIISIIVLLIIIFLILIINNTKLNVNKIANEVNHLTIGNQEIIIDNITSSTEINPPTVGARNDTNKMEQRRTSMGNNHKRR